MIIWVKTRDVDAAILRNLVGKSSSLYKLVQGLHRSFAKLIGVQKTLFSRRIRTGCRF